MPDRPHIVIPGNVTSSFATSEELTGDAAGLAALMRTARSRMVIATTSPDPSQCRQALIWMQPGPCVVARTATTPDGDTETHIYQIDNEEIPHVAAAISPLTPNPALRWASHPADGRRARRTARHDRTDGTAPRELFLLRPV